MRAKHLTSQKRAVIFCHDDGRPLDPTGFVKEAIRLYCRLSLPVVRSDSVSLENLFTPGGMPLFSSAVLLISAKMFSFSVRGAEEPCIATSPGLERFKSLTSKKKELIVDLDPVIQFPSLACNRCFIFMIQTALAEVCFKQQVGLSLRVCHLLGARRRRAENLAPG